MSLYVSSHLPGIRRTSSSRSAVGASSGGLASAKRLHRLIHKQRSDAPGYLKAVHRWLNRRQDRVCYSTAGAAPYQWAERYSGAKQSASAPHSTKQASRIHRCATPKAKKGNDGQCNFGLQRKFSLPYTSHSGSSAACLRGNGSLTKSGTTKVPKDVGLPLA